MIIKRLLLRSLAVSMLLAAAFFSCRTAGERQRMTIGDALNVYITKLAAYGNACQPTPPDLRDACWAWRDLLADCYVRIEDATRAREIGDATPQIDAMQKPCTALKWLPETPR